MSTVDLEGRKGVRLKKGPDAGLAFGWHILEYDDGRDVLCATDRQGRLVEICDRGAGVGMRDWRRFCVTASAAVNEAGRPDNDRPVPIIWIVLIVSVTAGVAAAMIWG